MSQQTLKKGWKLGKDSFNVLAVWFQDGNARTFYSLDWKHRFSSIRDEKIGFARFDLLISKYGRNAKNLLISKNDSAIPSQRTLLKFYQEGVPVEITEELRENIKNNLSNQTEQY